MNRKIAGLGALRSLVGRKMEGGGFLCSEKDYAMENPRKIWKEVERKDLGY